MYVCGGIRLFRSKPKVCPKQLFFIAAFILSLLFSVVPFDADFQHYIDYPCVDGWEVGIKSNKAFAEEGLNQQFIERMAENAGLSSADFVVTAGATASYATGTKLWGNAGWMLGSTLSESLDGLVDAADYPAWDDLSDSEKSEYGTKVEYDSAKFNSLMSAFGYGTVYEGFISSGGGTFEPGTEVQRSLSRLGRIGAIWKAGFGNKLSALQSLITDRSVITGFAVSTTVGFDSMEPGSYWPSNFPRNVYVNNGRGFWVEGTQRAGVNFWRYSSGTVVYFVVCLSDSKTGVRVFAFSKDPFSYTYGYDGNTQISGDARLKSKNGENYYTNWLATGLSFNTDKEIIVDPAIAYNIEFSFSSSDVDNFAYEYLFEHVITGESESIEGYPEPENPDELVYIPSRGLEDNSDWDDITTEPDGPVVPGPENPYNPDDQTGNDKWKNDVTENVLPLQNIKFDKLFPFSLLFDIGRFADKIEELTAGSAAQGNYTRLTIPIKTPVSNQAFTLELDLTPVKTMLDMTRPFVLILLAAGLLFVTVRFWQGILTG